MDVVFLDSPGMMHQPRLGKHGQIRINKKASYSALLHEYTHAMDDSKSGWQGMKYLYDIDKFIEFETRAYDEEILFCRLNNVPEEYIIRLEGLKEVEINNIKSRWE